MLTQNLLIQERNSENDCREAAIFKNSWVFWEHQNTSSPSFIYFFKFVCSVSKDRWRPRLCFMKLVSNRLRKASDGVWKTLRNIKDSDSPRAEYGSLRKVREVNVYVFFFFFGKTLRRQQDSAWKRIIQLTVRGVLDEISLCCQCEDSFCLRRRRQTTIRFCGEDV